MGLGKYDMLFCESSGNCADTGFIWLNNISLSALRGMQTMGTRLHTRERHTCILHDAHTAAPVGIRIYTIGFTLQNTWEACVLGYSPEQYIFP